MWVTVYADASFSENTGGSWAVWVRSDSGRIVRSGKCPRYVRNANAAELAALFAGVYIAASAWPRAIHHVLLCSDSTTALGCVVPGARLPRDRTMRKLRQKLVDLAREHDFTLGCRWVKGHQKRTAGSAAWLNGACDKLASKTRRSGKAAARS